MRMLAWINLLAPDGIGSKALHNLGIERAFLWIGLLDEPGGWLNGQPTTVILALVYGYIPFFILPLFVAIDRIDKRQIEAARDLGASPMSAFLRVTLPLSVPGILAGAVLIALPMFGDYYTADLVSASTQTNMIGNQIDEFMRQGSEKVTGAALTLLLSAFLLVLMFYYLRTTRRAGTTRRHELAAQPVGPAALPRGRHRLLRALVGRPGPARDRLRVQQRPLAHDVAGVLLPLVHRRDRERAPRPRAAGRARAHPAAGRDLRGDRDAARRGAGARAPALARTRERHRQLADAAAARDAGDRHGRRAPPAVPAHLPGIGLGTEAQAIGQVTFTLSYVVVIVRGRLVSIGPEFEEAAADLGAPPRDQLFRVLLPLLAPAIVASAAVAFAISIDDFVVTQYLSSDASTTTVSMLLYANARGAPTPALNAIATVGLAITLATLAAAFLVYRRFAGGQEATSLATLEV